eukprot:gene27748-35808_t
MEGPQEPGHGHQADLHGAGPWGQKFPTVVGAWRRVWDKVIPFFAFPPEVRRVIYTTNAIESVNARLRKIIKTRGHFPSDDAATKLIWLALRNITEDWGRAANNWKSAMNQFAILYEDRFTKSSTLSEPHTRKLGQARPLATVTTMASEHKTETSAFASMDFHTRISTAGQFVELLRRQQHASRLHKNTTIPSSFLSSAAYMVQHSLSSVSNLKPTYE